MKLKHTHLLLAVTLIVAAQLTACASETTSAPSTIPTASSAPPPTETEATTKPLDEVLASFVGDTAGGVEVLIKRDGVTQHVATGAASEAGDELVPGRPFRVGSIAKPFIAVMVLQLVEESRVDLDAPLGDYLPDSIVGLDVTIRQLLAHQSGIPNYTEQPSFFSDVLADPSLRYTTAEILAYVKEVPKGDVGQFAYSNTNYILLGQLIEHLDRTDINTSLQNRVTGPLSLENTSFALADQAHPDDLVGGWSPSVIEGNPEADYDAIATSAWTAGSLISTAEDLAAFLEALATGRIISPETLAAMTDFGPDGYGLGLSQVAFSTSQTGYGHNGSIPGYSSTMAIDPTTGDTLIILTNNDALIADRLAPQVLAIE